MFLNNLSTAKELASSRSGGSSSSGSGSGSSSGSGSGSSGKGGSSSKRALTQIEGFDDDEVFTQPCTDGLRVAEAGRPLLFGPGAPSPDDTMIPRTVILDYFRDCKSLMLDPSSLGQILSASDAKGLPLHYASMEFQRTVMERNFQIEPNFGCAFLSRIPQYYPGDEELVQAAKGFMFTALRSYIEVVKHRSSQLGPLRNSGGLTRNNIMEFFEVCNAKMAMPETKEYLKSVAAQAKQPPGDKVILIQRQLLEKFGVTADYGVSCLNKISTTYERDPEVVQKMQQFSLCAMTACRESMFTEAEREAYYAEIPPFMHHAPYMYAAQKQMEAQREMQKHQLLMSEDLQRIRGDPATLSKLEAFAARVKTVQQIVTFEVQAWSAERREAYFDEFRENPVLREVASGPAGLLRRFETFAAFSDAQIRDFMTLSAVIAEDIRASAAGGGNGKGPLFARGNNAMVQNVLQSWAALVRAGQQSLSSAGPTGTSSTGAGSSVTGASGESGHDHAGHVHGPNCKHAGPTVDHDHDVTSGEGARMER